MVLVLGIDPGKTTGWAQLEVVDKKIELRPFGETKDTTLTELIPLIRESDVIVYEAWLTRPKHLQRGAFDWNPMIAPQVIGSLLTLCKVLEKQQVVKQQPSIKPVGFAFAGMKYESKTHQAHWKDALAHAMFYSVKILQGLPVRRTS